MINSIIVPIEAFYDYFKSGKYPTRFLKSVCCNVCNKKLKYNYKKFANRINKAIKYLPPELEIEIREAVRSDG